MAFVLKKSTYFLEENDFSKMENNFVIRTKNHLPMTGESYRGL